ncbi:MAG: OmpH family outer membrane protein [Bacteroidales bacterium]|nr:OmpH family outer membrane protein [Bacteroidales bacterium]
MKKSLLILTILSIVAVAPAFAQKYGHVNSAEVMKQMPGVDSIQIQLLAFQEELANMNETMVKEFQTKKDKFDKEAGTMSTTVRQIREQELQDMAKRIQDFQANAQSDVEEKALDLQKPFVEKLQNAIKDVAKENGYTYVFDEQILLYFDNGDDVTPLVKKKLGIN